MKMIEDRTKIGAQKCVTFKKRTNEKNFIKIINGIGCNSEIGKLKSENSQIVNLNRDICMNKATIANNLVHALGFDHEHKRPDRDDWVKIDFKNIIGDESNIEFRKLDLTEFQDLGTPYDFKSIMHFHSKAYAKNNISDTIKAIKVPFEIQMNENLTEIDVQEIRKLYNCIPGTS